MDVFPLPLLVLLYEKFSLFSSKFKTIRSLEKGVGLKQLAFLSPCFFTGNILSIFISANLSFMASPFHCSRFHHRFFHPLLFNKSCPCLTKVQALPVWCFLGLFHKPIPALTENFCTLPFVLPAKSPPQAWQTLRWKRRKENFITPIFYSYLSCSCVCSCSILPKNAIRSSLKSFFCGVWM